MDIKDLNEEQKNKIISECINTRKTFKVIAKENNTTIDAVYEIMYKYCKDNNYISFKRTSKGIVFEKNEDLLEKKKKQNKKSLKNAQEIEKWCEDRNKKPRSTIKKEEEEVKEKKLGTALIYIRNNIVDQYKKHNVNEIENEIHREIVRIIRKIDEEYSDNEQKYLKNAQEIEKWSEEKNRKPRSVIGEIKPAKKGEQETELQKEVRLGRALSTLRRDIVKLYKTYEIENIENRMHREIVTIVRNLDARYSDNRKERTKEVYLKDVQEIEKWSKEKNRKPRYRIKEIKPAKKDEKETELQREIRLARTLASIKQCLIKQYKGMELDEIENKEHREIVRIVRELDKKYLKEGKIYLSNAQEIEKWCEERKRKPRSAIGEIKPVKKGEQETELQREVRLGRALVSMKQRLIKPYKGMELDEIENEIYRETVRIVREVESKYIDNRKRKKSERNNGKEIKKKTNFVKTLGNDKMKKMILKLVQTKNATNEQINVIANFYGVDLGKIENIEEER